MKKLLLASAVTLAGLSVIATPSHAADKYRQNSAYCRLSNTTDILCKKKEWQAATVQGLAAPANTTNRVQSKYCQEGGSLNDPICIKKVKYNAPAYESAEDPISVGSTEPIYMEIEDPIWVDADEPVTEAGAY
jgi:hypothetical protein